MRGTRVAGASEGCTATRFANFAGPFAALCGQPLGPVCVFGPRSHPERFAGYARHLKLAVAPRFARSTAGLDGSRFTDSEAV